MTTPKGMAKTYEGRRYRCVQNGKKVEEVLVPVGSYEDTRLGLEVIEGESGWQLVDGDADADQPDDTVPAEVVSDANEDSRPDPEAEQLPVEHTTEALGQPDGHDDTQEGADT